jgi:hypothetical protein
VPIGKLNPAHYDRSQAIKLLESTLVAAAGLSKHDTEGSARVFHSLAVAFGCFNDLQSSFCRPRSGAVFLSDPQLLALQKKRRWSYNKFEGFIASIKQKIPPAFEKGIGSVAGVKRKVKEKVCPRGRSVAAKHLKALGATARVIPVVDHTAAVASNAALQDALLVGFDTWGLKLVVIASIDHLNVTKIRGLEVCYTYVLNIWKTRHSVDAPISGIFDIKEIASEMGPLNEELYYPSESDTERGGPCSDGRFHQSTCYVPPG